MAHPRWPNPLPWRTRIAGMIVIILMLISVGCEGVPPRIIGFDPPEPSVAVGDVTKIQVNYAANGHKIDNFSWDAEAGEIIGNGKSLVTYRAPDTPGTYNISVQLQYSGGTVEGAVVVNVVLSTSTPTFTPTDTLTPLSNDMPTPTPTNTPSPTITQTPTPASAPTPTPTPVTPPTPVGSEIMTILASKNSLTVYVPENVTSSLQDLNLEYRTSTGTAKYVFANSDAFAPYVDGTVPPPFCLHLERANSDTPFPSECQSARKPSLGLPDGSVFWWDTFAKSTKTLFVNSGDAIVGICDAGFSHCVVKMP